MRFLSLCSGIEAASVAWKHLGWEAVGFAEIEPFPSAVLAHHYPTVKNYGDITKYKEWGISPGTVDLICGGPPCQAFSIAGARAGMADPRGNLTLTYLALVDHLRPKWIVYENVPGLLSSNGGADFARFIEGLALCGYHCAWRVYDPAQSFGRHRLPQRRRRVFLVGYLGAWEPPATVLFKPQGGGWDSAKGAQEGEETSSGITNGFDSYGIPYQCGTICADHTGGVLEPVTFQPGNLSRHAGAEPSTTTTTTLKASMGDQFPHIAYASEVSQTVTSGAPFQRTGNERVECEALVSENIARGPHAVATAPAYAVRRLTVTECLRLQGFPDGYTSIAWRGKPADQCPDGPQYKAIGNSWAVTVARHIGEQIQLWETSNPSTK